MSHPRRPRRRKGRHLVTDRDGLAGLIRQAVRERYGGSQRQAAREMAGPRASPRDYEALRRLIGRLAQGAMGSITERTLQRIRQLVGPEKQRLLTGPHGEPLLAPGERLLLVLQQRWIEGELARTPRTRDLEGRLRGKHPTLFRSFDRFLVRKGYVEIRLSLSGRSRGVRRTLRAELAFREVLIPLIRDRAGRIERRATEFSPTEMRDYLRHALAAQRILLRRPPDIARARSAVAAVEADKAERRQRQPEARRPAEPLPRLGWRVTGEPKPKPPERLEVSEMDQRLRVTRASKKWKLLGRYVSAEVDRPRPRRDALEWLTKVTEPIEKHLPESFRRSPFYLSLTGELRAGLEALDRKKGKRRRGPA